ncbi:MAG: SDR family NAD(P)-dependent oxidoreductase [Nitrososphaerales archaeon]
MALVTGASGTLGGMISQGLATFGADLILAGRNQEKLNASVKAVEKFGGRNLVLEADLSNPSGIDSLLAKVLDAFGRIDILVNAHGINIRKPTDSMTIEEWEKVLDTNLKSVFLSCQAIGKEMIKRKSGKIVSVSSLAGRLGYDKGYSAYGPSKAAVDALTRVLAAEWGKYNINVNAISPYFIRTPLTANVLRDKEFYDWVLRGVPMNRLGVPEDIVGAVVFLCSRASDWVNGQIIYIDGGRSIT